MFAEIMYCHWLPISDKILATPWVSQSLKSGKLDVYKPHSYLTANQTDIWVCRWLRKEWVHISLVCVAALDCWHAHVTLGCRKWLEHTRGIEPAAPAWLTETRVTTKWSEDEREPSFTLERTQYLNSHRLDATAEPLFGFWFRGANKNNRTFSPSALATWRKT